MTTRDVHVEFDVASARKYIRAITQSIAAVLVVAIAVMSASRQWIEDAVRIELTNNTFSTSPSERKYSQTLGLAAVGGAALALVLLVVPKLLLKTLETQRCWITPTQIVCESGWLNRTVQTIPLDRIQDLSVKQGFLQRRFGLFSIEVQTAGSPRPFPELVLYAPRDASSVRDAIMARRDALVLQTTAASRTNDSEIRAHVAASPRATLSCASDAHASLQQIDRATSDALAELNRTTQRIEALLTKVLDAVATAERGH